MREITTADFESPEATDAREITGERVREVLATVRYPGLSRDLVSFGMVEHVSVCDRRVKVRLAIATRDPGIPAQLRTRIADALLPLGAATVAVGSDHPGTVDLSLGDVCTGTHRVRRQRCERDETVEAARVVTERLARILHR